jgi:ABC-type transport system involved in multi-copper enzyme maturation permease subunit
MNSFVYRLHSIKAIIKREARSSFFGLGLYIAATIACFVASFIFNSYINTVQGNNIMVMASPLNNPLFYAVIVAALYTAISSSTALSREKDKGTLEVLFYGPVDYASIILAKFLEDIISFLIVMLLVTLFFVYAAVTTNLGFSITYLYTVFLAIFLAASMSSFGLWLSALTTKIRTSILLFILIMGGFLGLQFLEEYILTLKPENLSLSMIYIMGVLSNILRIIKWASPFSYLTNGISAVALGSTSLYLENMLGSLAYTVLLLVLTVYTLKWKGVRKP